MYCSLGTSSCIPHAPSASKLYVHRPDITRWTNWYLKIELDLQEVNLSQGSMSYMFQCFNENFDFYFKMEMEIFRNLSLSDRKEAMFAEYFKGVCRFSNVINSTKKSETVLRTPINRRQFYDSCNGDAVESGFNMSS